MMLCCKCTILKQYGMFNMELVIIYISIYIREFIVLGNVQIIRMNGNNVLLNNSNTVGILNNSNTHEF